MILAAMLAVTVVTGEYQMPGMLAMPEGKGPFPAVVLVSGSGPNDMDSTVGPNKPFRDMAEGLAAHGIASIRYAKRTRQYGAKLGPDITLAQEILDDALSAAKLLRATPGIDPKRVFVAGHSLGGYAAPWIGQADPSLAGLIILAGATRPVDVLIDDQVRYLGIDPAQGEKIKKMMSDAYRAEVSRDPVPVARELKMPMLVLQGARDYQVTLTDFAGWKKIEGPRVTLKLYPAMNHLFQPGQGKSLPAEYRMVAPFSPAVIDDIADWVKKR